jgi:hypothetical protein
MMMASASHPFFDSASPECSTNPSQENPDEYVPIGSGANTAAKSFQEIADVLDLPIDEVKIIYNRAIRKLRRDPLAGPLLRIYEQFQAMRTEPTRKIPTPYARTMRGTVMDAPPSKLQEAPTL